jgi:LysM repeat protein
MVGASHLTENMEVLMSRNRRISRRLIAATAIVLALGLIFWGSKLLHHAAHQQAAAATQPAQAKHMLLASATTAPSAPATQPAAPAPLIMTTPLLAASTTQPVQTQASAAKAPVQLAMDPQPPASVGAIPTNVGMSPGLVALPKEGDTIVAPASAIPLSTQPLVDAKAKLDGNHLLDARRILEAALMSGKLSSGDVTSAKTTLSTINKTVVFSPRRFPEDEFGGSYVVKPGDVLQHIAAQNDVTWQLLCRINGLLDPRRLRAGQTIKVIKGPFCAVVYKKAFTMDIYLGSPGEKGSIYVTSFPVGLGKDDSTPTGVWMVEPHNKIKHPTYYSPRGGGVIAADDPANPLGGFWIGLSGIDGHAVGKTSYGIHGTIDPNSIGKMESMGCIRLRHDDITLVFELLVEGKSTVVVKD